MAQDDASLAAGWNVAPNIAYTLLLLPGASSCGVYLYDEDGTTMIASGAALAGTDQPCVLIPQSGQTVEMVDADLGWHLLLTTTGTESQRTIRLGPAVDLPDEIHPVYGNDGMALARATAAIDAAAHYIDDVTITCPLGLGAGLGNIVSVPVDGVAVVGQVESITWTATPDGTTEQAVIRRHVAIAPDAFAEVTPPTVADDTGTATHTTGTSGNVLANDESGLTVTAVNGLAANVGVAVDGDNGGSFTIAANGAWTFSPDGDFALLSGSETADTSVTYHASDGTAESMATLTVAVSHTNAAPVATDDTGETDAATTTSGNVLTNDTDTDLDALTVSQVSGSAGNVGVAVAGSSGGLFTIGGDGAWTFDPNSDFDSLTGDDTAMTTVTYHVSDGVAEDEGTLTVTVSAAVSQDIQLVGTTSGVGTSANFSVPVPAGVMAGDLILVFISSASSSVEPATLSPGYTKEVALVRSSTRTARFVASWKIATDPVDTSITINGSGDGLRQVACAVQVWRNVNAATPFDVGYTSASGQVLNSTAAINPPAITPVTDGAVVTVGACCALPSNTNISGLACPSGSNDCVFVLSSATYRCPVLAFWYDWTGGPVDPAAFGTISGSSQYCGWIAVTFALRPA